MNLRLLFFALLTASTAFGQTPAPARMRHFLQSAPSPPGAVPYSNTPKAGRYVTAGERDQNAPLTTVIAACGMIPNGQFGIIPHAGHPVFLENFPTVWACIAPFLHEKPGH